MARVSEGEREMHVMVPWAQYVAVVRGSVSERYARFYAPLALVLVVLVFAPLFRNVTVPDALEGERYRSGHYTIFDLADLPGGSGGPAIIAVGLVFGLAGCLAWATFRVRSPRLPSVIAGLAAVLAILIQARPGLGRFEPTLDGFGVAALILAVATALLGAAHAVHLARAR